MSPTTMVAESVRPTDFTLTNVDFYITSYCNRHCAHCFLSEAYFADRRHMSLQTVAGLLEWCDGSVEEVTLLGGEPSLHPQFADLVSLVGSTGREVRVVTNGSSAFRSKIRDPAIRQYLTRVSVSLDAPDEQLFDALRGPRAFRDVMETVSLLKEYDIPFDINFTVLKSALPRVREMMQLADELDARRINIHWFSTIGRAREQARHEEVSETEWRTVLTRVSEFVPKRDDFIVDCQLAFAYGLPGEKSDMCAVRDRSNLQFFPDGSVYSCGIMVDEPDSSAYVWDGELRQRASPGSEISQTTSACAGCPVRQADGEATKGSHALCIYNRLSR